jgi:hypothetical protein
LNKYNFILGELWRVNRIIRLIHPKEVTAWFCFGGPLTANMESPGIPLRLFNMNTFLGTQEVGYERTKQVVSVDIDHGSGVSYCRWDHNQSSI